MTFILVAALLAVASPAANRPVEAGHHRAGPTTRSRRADHLRQGNRGAGSRRVRRRGDGLCRSRGAQGRARRRRALLERVRAQQAGTPRRRAAGDCRAEERLSEEPVASRRPGAGSRDPAGQRPDGRARSQRRRRPEADGAGRADERRPRSRAAAGRADAGQQPVRQGPRSCAVRARAERVAQGPRGAGAHRAHRRPTRTPRSAPSGTWACLAGTESRQALVDIYKSSQSVSARKAVLQGFMVAGDRARLLEVARTETSPELKREAIHMIGVSGGRDELWQLYQQETSVEAKDAIINALFISGDADRLAELAQKETDPRLRREAIQKLGLTGASKSAAVLKQMYGTEKDARHQAHDHQRVLHPGQRRDAGRDRARRAGPEAEAGRRAEAVVDAVEGSRRLHDGAAEVTARTLVAAGVCAVLVPLVSALPPALPDSPAWIVIEAGATPPQAAATGAARPLDAHRASRRQRRPVDDGGRHPALRQRPALDRLDGAGRRLARRPRQSVG